MKILIIGSKGFIGSHCMKHFMSIGCDVYGCDVVVDYISKKYLQVDATNANFNDVFETNQFDACINCSGAASVPDSFIHPARDFNLNVHNVHAILDAIRKENSNCKFVNLSSAAVYGNPVGLPILESMPVNPLSPYGWHKYYSEMICQEFSKFYQIRACSLRIFSAFGPGLKKQIFWDWFQNSKLNSELELYGTGNESRDFIYIDDLVRAIECVVLNAPFKGEVVNVASGKETKISLAASVFNTLIESPMRYSFNMHVRKGDPLNWRADISILKSYGFISKVPFEHGLKTYLKWVVKQ